MNQKEFVFDIILSVGGMCRPAHYLKKHSLRCYAHPLDWMADYSLDTVIRLYKTGFSDFFTDFVEDKQKSLQNNTRCFFDNRNDIVAVHYYNIESDNKAFREKMKNRFEKINNILSTANKICFISNRNEDVELLKKFLKEMGGIYSGNITYINIRDNREIDTIKYSKEKVSEKLELIEYEFNDVHPGSDVSKMNEEAWIGNYTVWDDIMSRISVRLKNIETRKSIKIHFTDFGSEFVLESFFLYELLSRKYQLVIDEDNPDYLIFSCYGNEHLDYHDCVKIYCSDENLFPDFNLCDYATGFARLQLGDRFLRFPPWAHQNRESLFLKTLPDEAVLLNRKFCHFAYPKANNADPFAVRFFKRLSEYKRVDWENNVAGYKFNIVFENSSVDGYTTGKLIEPMLVNSLPVYWGNPSVDLDFNRESFIYVKDYDAIDEAIAEIIALDNDDNAYLEKLRKPWFLNRQFKGWKEEVANFLYYIIEQDKDKAMRRTKYGHNFYYANSYLVLY